MDHFSSFPAIPSLAVAAVRADIPLRPQAAPNCVPQPPPPQQRGRPGPCKFDSISNSENFATAFATGGDNCWAATCYVHRTNKLHTATLSYPDNGGETLLRNTGANSRGATSRKAATFVFVVIRSKNVIQNKSLSSPRQSLRTRHHKVHYPVRQSPLLHRICLEIRSNNILLLCRGRFLYAARIPPKVTHALPISCVGLAGGHKECIQNFGEETFLERFLRRLDCEDKTNVALGTTHFSAYCLQAGEGRTKVLNPTLLMSY
jgi:hypothetical protein